MAEHDPIADAARRPAILTLVIMASVGALSLNIFLPSLPAIARHYEVDYSSAQLLVSLYLAALAAIQLLIGPASDRFGRRPVLLACFFMFCVATLGAQFAPTMNQMLAWRVLQSFSAGGIVLSRVIIRDTTPMERSASLIGYVTMGMSVTPMVAPLIGGYLDEHFGWRSTFQFAFAFGCLALIVVWANVRETNLSRTSSFGAQFRAYPALLKSRRFWGYTLTATFASGVFFAFLGGAPFVSTEMLGMSPAEYGLYFSLLSLGYLFGNFLSGRFAQVWGMNRLMMWGNIVSLAGMGLMLTLFAAGYNHPLSLFLPSMLMGVGNGMTMPSANTGIVSVKPHLAGSASGLGGAMMLGGGAVLAWLASALLDKDSGPYPLILVCLASAVLATASTAIVIRRTRQVGELEP